jgi:hypothetical protein
MNRTWPKEMFMKRVTFVLIMVTCVSAALLTGCAAVMPPPPLPADELVVRAPPSPGAAWVRGHWQWRGWQHRYVLVRGHWNLRRHHVRVIVR